MVVGSDGSIKNYCVQQWAACQARMVLRSAENLQIAKNSTLVVESRGLHSVSGQFPPHPTPYPGQLPSFISPLDNCPRRTIPLSTPDNYILVNSPPTTSVPPPTIQFPL